MASYQASLQSVSLVQALQSLPSFSAEFDAAKHAPVIAVNVNELVHTVGMLWGAMRDQRGFLELVEKELARRKTETEVRLQTMQRDIEGLVTQEAKKRQLEDEKVRAEIVTARDEMSKAADQVRRESKEMQEATQRSLDRAINGVKTIVTDVQSRVTDIVSELNNMRAEIQRVGREKDTLGQLVDKVRSEAQSNFTTICSFLGSNSTVVTQAVSNGTEKDTLLKTPALQTLASRIRVTDDKAEATKNELSKISGDVQQMNGSISRLVGDVKSVEQSLLATQQSLKDAILLGDDKLSQRLDLLERGVNAQLAHLSKNVAAGRGGGPSSTPTSDVTVDAAKKGDLEALRASMEAMKQEFLLRFAAKAEQSSVNTSLGSLQDIVSKQEEDIAALFAELRGGGRPRASDASRGASGDVESLRVELGDLVARVDGIENQTQRLQETKADRAELRLALADLAKKLEVGLSELYNQIQQQKARMPSPPQNHQDSTAGRFRCISCNRDAGPLQEQIQERISKSQFPPSPMLVSQASQQQQQQMQQQPRVIVNSRGSAGGGGVVPGMKDYGGGLTSSRKKLMNYYVWLHEKGDGTTVAPGQAQQQQGSRRPMSAGKSRTVPSAESAGCAPADDVRRDSPSRTNSPSHPPSHPWSGAQSGGGNYAERQCGDHGTEDPESVGSDGKYYVGVLSSTLTPTSSALAASRPKSAPLQGRGGNAPAN